MFAGDDLKRKRNDEGVVIIVRLKSVWAVVNFVRLKFDLGEVRRVEDPTS